MTIKFSCFFSRQGPILLLSIALRIVSMNVDGARVSTIFSSTPLSDTLSNSRSTDSHGLEIEPKDTGLLSARDFSPDVLDTAVHVSPISHKTEGQLHSESKDLHLRSSLYNVSGIAGYRMYSLPILAGELASLLGGTRTDLLNHDAHSKTPIYQFSTKKWSFSVLTANAPIPYVYIQSIVSHFIKLSPPSSSPSDITSTRVGVVLNGSIPIADVIIMPCPNTTNHSYVPFSSFGVHRNTSSIQPTEVLTVTPFGSSCSYAVVNESAALTPFATNENVQGILQPRSIETEIIRHVGQTMFDISMRLMHRQDGIPARTTVWAAAAVATIALLRVNLQELKNFLLIDFRGDPVTDEIMDELFSLDTGFFDIGRLTGRLVMEITRRNSKEKIMLLTLETWGRIVMTLLAPFGGMNLRSETWAMEGEIHGPENGDGDGEKNSSKVVVGRWELFLGPGDY